MPDKGNFGGILVPPEITVGGVVVVEHHPHDSRLKLHDDGVVQTLSSRMGTGGNNVPLLLKIRCGCEGGGKGALMQENKSATISCNNDQILFEPTTYGIGRDAFNQGKNAQYKPVIEEELQPTLVAKGAGACMDIEYRVRRLTPTECARLQGFPDDWCDNAGEGDVEFFRKVFDTYSELMGVKKKTDKQISKWLKNPRTDAAEYKMWGNGVALPCVWFVLAGIAWENENEEEKKC